MRKMKYWFIRVKIIDGEHEYLEKAVIETSARKTQAAIEREWSKKDGPADYREYSADAKEIQWEDYRVLEHYL